MNKDSPIGKYFPKLPRYGERFIDTRTRSKISNHDLLAVIDIFFNFSKQFSLKHGSNKCRKLLESFKKRELKLLGRQAQYLQYNNFQKKWLDLRTCIVLAKVCKQ